MLIGNAVRLALLVGVLAAVISVIYQALAVVVGFRLICAPGYGSVVLRIWKTFLLVCIVEVAVVLGSPFILMIGIGGLLPRRPRSPLIAQGHSLRVSGVAGSGVPSVSLYELLTSLNRILKADLRNAVAERIHQDFKDFHNSEGAWEGFDHEYPEKEHRLVRLYERVKVQIAAAKGQPDLMLLDLKSDLEWEFFLLAAHFGPKRLRALLLNLPGFEPTHGWFGPSRRTEHMGKQRRAITDADAGTSRVYDRPEVLRQVALSNLPIGAQYST